MQSEAQKDKQKYYCWKCGQQLSEENCRLNPNSQSGLSFMCVECEADFYNDLEKIEGRYIALFHTCAALDIPLKPFVLDGIDFGTTDEPFITYINALSEQEQDYKGDRLLGFEHGVTTLSGLFGNSLSQKDFAECIKREKEIITKRKEEEKTKGTPEQKAKWGKSDDYRTRDDYDELDRLYEARASSFKGQYITPQMENTLINVAKWSFKMNQLLSQKNPNFHGAKALSDMIDKALASENMRKKDEKPTEEFRIDSLVVALEKAGLMENGDLLSYDELQAKLASTLIGGKKYDYSVDVANQVVLDVLNAMRKNADLMPLLELPAELEIKDIYAECETEETDEEKKRKEFAQLTKVQFVNKTKN